MFTPSSADDFTPPDHGRQPRERGRLSLPDSPIVTGFTAAVTIALAVVLFITAMPGENRVLLYRGERVDPGGVCEAVDASGDTVVRACSEVGGWESYPTDWSVVPLIIAVVLAAAAGYVVYHIPQQVRDRRKQQQDAMDRLTGEDFPRL